MKIKVYLIYIEVSKLKFEDLNYDLPDEPIDEKNWDLETWRKEYPMDYFKALSIMMMVDNSIVKTEVFKAIYCVTRMCVPNVLYKYYSLSNDEALNMKKFQTLGDCKVYMSDIKDFNDPFDGKGFFYDPTQLDDIKLLKNSNGRLIDDFTEFIKCTCFTSNGVQSMPMWAHYGGNHTGFCVAYDTNINPALKSNTFPVQYTDERLDITTLMRAQARYICNELDKTVAKGEKVTVIDDLSIIYMALLLYNLKHTSWSYEKEFRCTTATNAPGMPYIDAKPKEIYIGMNCTSQHTKKLIGIAENLKIPVYKMEFNEYSEGYGLVAQKLN